ncbi:hypothetical protein ACO0LB_19100 [Undibacterium sp. SXout7W]|uniref:hypothetical protein n=1 Tax=Undibacterium sp. SXout7W TaxID=3413049 RepID=UPI003BF40870
MLKKQAFHSVFLLPACNVLHQYQLQHQLHQSVTRVTELSPPFIHSFVLAFWLHSSVQLSDQTRQRVLRAMVISFIMLLD